MPITQNKTMSKIIKIHQGNKWILSEEIDEKINGINIQVYEREVRMSCYAYTLTSASIYKDGKLNGLAIIPFNFKFFSVSDSAVGICNYVNSVPSGDFFAFSEECRVSDTFYSDFEKANHDFLESTYNRVVQFYKTQSQKSHEEHFICGQYDEKGQLNGSYLEQTGSCRVICQYKNGVLDGSWKKYGRYTDGDRLIEEKMYHLGEEVHS